MAAMKTIDSGSWSAVKVLAHRLGVLETLRVGVMVARALRRGEPFAHLGPPTDARDRESRAQAAPALALYRALRARGRSDAREIVAEVVEAAAVVFLARTIGPIRRATLAAMSEPERERWVRERAARFPNAEPTFDAVGPEGVRFRVSACRFVALCHAAGAPELAPVFCRGDARYFGTVEPDVVLERPHTLAEGGPDCPFTIRFRDPAR